MIGIGGVLITDIAANVVGGYISDRIKTWQVPEGETAAPRDAPKDSEAAVAAVPARQPEASAAPEAEAAMPVEGKVSTETVAARDPLPLAPQPEPALEPEPVPDEEPLPEPAALPAPPMQPLVLNGLVERVIDTGTLKIGGETVLLAGIKGLGSPYRDQLAKFIEEQGSEVRCTPSGVRHTCFVSNVDIALAALTNGAARLAPDATEQYRAASDEAKRNHRGVFQ